MEPGRKQTYYEAFLARAFSGLGIIPAEYCIRLKPEAVPCAICVPRRMPVPLRAQIKTEIEKMPHMCVFHIVEGPTEWCAGIVPIVKTSGEVRVCVDLTQLNKSTLRERFALPTVDQALGSLVGAKWL